VCSILLKNFVQNTFNSNKCLMIYTRNALIKTLKWSLMWASLKEIQNSSTNAGSVLQQNQVWWKSVQEFTICNNSDRRTETGVLRLRKLPIKNCANFAQVGYIQSIMCPAVMCLFLRFSSPVIQDTVSTFSYITKGRGGSVHFHLGNQ